MRIGVFGGTFDPVHLGHLALAEQCRDQCRLDEVWFVPAGVPPHKTSSDITPGPDRLRLLELAVAGHEQFRIQRWELERSAPAYTFETLEHFHEIAPENEYFLILGADSVRDLPEWRNPHRILQLARIIGVNRGDDPGPDRDELSREFSPEEMARMEFISIPGLEISSTDLRARVRSGRSIRYLVPRAVEIAIGQGRFYRDLP